MGAATRFITSAPVLRILLGQEDHNLSTSIRRGTWASILACGEASVVPGLVVLLVANAALRPAGPSPGDLGRMGQALWPRA
jgi:hypothetical protein